MVPGAKANAAKSAITKDSTVKETVFNLETGEERPADPKLAGIAEGDEDEDN